MSSLLPRGRLSYPQYCGVDSIRFTGSFYPPPRCLDGGRTIVPYWPLKVVITGTYRLNSAYPMCGCHERLTNLPVIDAAFSAYH